MIRDQLRQKIGLYTDSYSPPSYDKRTRNATLETTKQSKYMSTLESRRNQSFKDTIDNSFDKDSLCRLRLSKFKEQIRKYDNPISLLIQKGMTNTINEFWPFFKLICTILETC